MCLLKNLSPKFRFHSNVFTSFSLKGGRIRRFDFPCFQYGASLSITKKKGNTALQEAGTTKQLAVVTLLIQEGRRGRFEVCLWPMKTLIFIFFGFICRHSELKIFERAQSDSTHDKLRAFARELLRVLEKYDPLQSPKQKKENPRSFVNFFISMLDHGFRGVGPPPSWPKTKDKFYKPLITNFYDRVDFITFSKEKEAKRQPDFKSLFALFSRPWKRRF